MAERNPLSANLDTSEARAVLVGVDLGPGASFDPSLDELALLAESAGAATTCTLESAKSGSLASITTGSIMGLVSAIVPTLVFGIMLRESVAQFEREILDGEIPDDEIPDEEFTAVME